MSFRPVRLTAAAEEDLLEAVTWYRKEAPHVVPRFRQRVREGLHRIGGSPLHFPAVHGEVRRILLVPSLTPAGYFRQKRMNFQRTFIILFYYILVEMSNL